LHACNVTAGTVSWNFANASTCVASTAMVFGKAIAANSVDQLFFSPGLKTPASGLMRAFASAATSINLTVIYDEEEI
jgi:predicted secreted Zn-dependent protease